MIAASCLVLAALLGLPASAQQTLSLSQKKCHGGWPRPPRHGHRPKTAVVPETDDQSFWFANFTVGAATRTLLIDTGSSDVYLNPGEYAPSHASKNLHQNFTITFATTNSNGSGTETLSGPLYRDLVATHGLAVPQQELGATADPASPPTFPHDGLIGFAGQASSAFNGTPWFHNLCDEHRVQQCRFGLAFNTDNTGTQILGTVDPAYQHSLSVAPLDTVYQEWAIEGDIAVNGAALQPNRTILTDSGTSVIYGPIADVQAIYEDLHIPYTIVPGDAATQTPTYLYGYIPCNNPPTVGFGFPSADAAKAAAANPSSPVSKTSTIFDIEPAAWSVQDNGNNNCTAVLQGTDQFPFWLVGQAFFQGHYIDHNVDQQTMGFANLKNKDGGYKSKRWEA